MINLQKVADSFYYINRESQCSSSLQNFLKEQHLLWGSNTRVLEVGCGTCSLFESLFPVEFFSVLAIDISAVAIEIANANKKDDRVTYLKSSLEELEFLGEFDLIVDSHLLHFYTDIKKRESYLKKISSLLKETAFFLGESMVYNKGLEFLLPYYFSSEDYILYKMNQEEWVAQRVIKPVYDLEQELLNHFSIEYLYIDSCSEFQIEKIKKSHVAAVKFICKKN